jgi:hypothetical protein
MQSNFKSMSSSGGSSGSGGSAGSGSSSGTSNSQKNRQALAGLKQEIANEAGIQLKSYNGDLTSREAGRIGGGITKRVIEQMENSMSGR